MVQRLGPGLVVVDHDLRRLVGIRLGVFPALHRGPHEAHHLVGKGRVGKVRLQHVKPVLQHPHALVEVVEGDQLVRRDPGIQHLTVFVIGHHRDAVGLLLQQRIDVERLLQHLDPVGLAGGADPQLGHPGVERIFVAIEPDPQRVALEIGRRGDAGFLQAGQLQPAMLERLGDVDQRQAAFARGKRGGHPVDDHIGAAAGDHLLGRDVRDRPA